MLEEDPATDTGNMRKIFVKIARVVPEISCRTNRQTDRQTERHTDTHVQTHSSQYFANAFAGEVIKAAKKQNIQAVIPRLRLTTQKGQHPLTGQRAANFRRDLGAT